MRADAYGNAVFDSPIQDILRMPLPGTDPDLETADIDDCFEPFDDAVVHDNAISTGLLDNDVHPAVAQARQSQNSNPVAQHRRGTAARDGNETEAQARAVMPRGDGVAARGGSEPRSAIGHRWGMQALISGGKRP
eukprot:756204-Rhodomonas_salina.2